jgi:hypothetical protein
VTTAPDPFNALGLTPFNALGLTPSDGLTDQQVRDAWRAVATATHPDRADGGDPERYARASAAYGELRTAWGRSEAVADMRETAPPGYGPAPEKGETGTAELILNAVAVFPKRVRHGRPWHIAVRAAAAAAVAWAAVIFTAGTPSAPAVAFGCALWFLLTSRHDLAPPPGR